MSERRIMSEGEASSFILRFLSDGKRHSTLEVEGATTAQGVQCPDSPAKFLMKMQMRGIIGGELDAKARGWVWWGKAAW
jgi:hypothetical protein